MLSISISFDDLLYLGSTEDFWKSFGNAINLAVSESELVPKGPPTSISSRVDLKLYFHKDSWDVHVVLLLDELSCLYQAADDVRNDCLQAFRGLKYTRGGHVIQGVIAAGTFGIVNLNPTTSAASPFNVADYFVQSPYFSIDETRKLFGEFAENFGYLIDDAIVVDVWAKSNGLVAQLDWCIVPKIP